MLFGVLRMPFDMAMETDLSRFQFYERAQQAADRIEKLETALEIIALDTTNPYIVKAARKALGHD